MAKREKIRMVEPAEAAEAAAEPLKPRNEGISFSDNWLPLALSGGGALLAHSVASSLFDKSEEEKRKESIWSKLLGTLIPLGVGAAGAYGGYRLGEVLGGKPLVKTSQAKATNDWTRVTSDSGEIKVDTPDEYADNVEALLDLLYKEKGEAGVTDLESLKEKADEIAKRMEGLEPYRIGAKVTPWLEGGAGVMSAYNLGKGGWQMFASRPGRIQANYQKAVANNVATPHPGPAPDVMDPKFYGKPEEYVKARMQHQQQLAQHKAETTPRAATARSASDAAATKKMRSDIAASGKNFRQGAKDVAKGFGWGALTWTLDEARDWLNGKIQKGEREGAVGKGFADIYDTLSKRNQNAVPLQTQKK